MRPSTFPSVTRRYRLERPHGDGAGQRLPALSEDGLLPWAGAPLRCARCGARITSGAERTRRQGAHEHQCINPHGIRFHIGCFRQAPGCITLGPPTTEATWFPGYAWEIALCGQCRSHLGWRFLGTDGGDGFFGLILAQLAGEA